MAACFRVAGHPVSGGELNSNSPRCGVGTLDILIA
jgi:hypothetical protein